MVPGAGHRIPMKVSNHCCIS